MFLLLFGLPGCCFLKDEIIDNNIDGTQSPLLGIVVHYTNVCSLESYYTHVYHASILFSTTSLSLNSAIISCAHNKPDNYHPHLSLLSVCNFVGLLFFQTNNLKWNGMNEWFTDGCLKGEMKMKTASSTPKLMCLILYMGIGLMKYCISLLNLVFIILAHLLDYFISVIY